MNMKQNNKLRNPWPGLASYEDPAKSLGKLKFCGRDSETFDIVRLIDDNFLLTLYGKSGIGKTSLLNAGVFPVLRREQYTPLSIRLGVSDISETFQDILTTSIENTFIENGGNIRLINVVEEQTDRTASDYLWNWFARRRFTDAKGVVTFPIIVLDQFEEVFRGAEVRNKAEILLTQIHYLIDECHALNDCIVDNEEYCYDFNFRFVLSIREDDLFRLEDSIDNCALVTLKRCRYRLRNLSEQSVRDIIRIPGDKFIRAEELKQVEDEIIQSLEKGSIEGYEASELSLMCSQIYKSMINSQLMYISVDLVKNSAVSSIQDYYKSIIHELGLSSKEIESFEGEFVTDSGRRSFVSEDRYKKLFSPNICDELLNSQSEYKILTKSNGKIEIVHDLLAKAVKSVKDERAISNLGQFIKQEKLICYLSLFPILLLVLVSLYRLLPPILDFLVHQNISDLYDIVDYPNVRNKSLLVVPLIFVWWLPKLILKLGKWIKHIDIDQIYSQVSRVYIGFVLLFIWYIYYKDNLTEWAPGIIILPFLAAGLWVNYGKVQWYNNPYLCLFVALGYSIIPLIRSITSDQILYYLICSVLIIVVGLVYLKKINSKLRIGIAILLFILAGVISCNNEYVVYLWIIVLLFTIICLCVDFGRKVGLCTFYILMILGVFIGICQVNPYLLMRYYKNIKIIPQFGVVTTESDSVYIRSIWKGEKSIDWPLVAREGSIFGVLPIKDSLEVELGEFGLFPFLKYIPNEGYGIGVISSFFEGIKSDNLKKNLDAKLNAISADSTKVNYSPDYNLKRDIIHPIKLNTAGLFDELMSAVSLRIRNQIALNADCNSHYVTIDSLCRTYLDGFRKQIKTERIAERDLYFYYRLTVCQMMNSLILEYLNRDDIHSTIRYLSFFVYLNLSEEALYSRINTTINFNIDQEIQQTISGNIVDDEVNIMKIRDFFMLISGAATMQQTQWTINDVKRYTSMNKPTLDLDVSADIARKEQYTSIMSYNENPYLKSFCQYQGELLTDVIGNMKMDNRVYQSYFEDIVDRLMLIQPFISDSYLRELHELKIEELKRAENEISENIKLIDGLNKDYVDGLDEIITRKKEITKTNELIKDLLKVLNEKLDNKSE